MSTLYLGYLYDALSAARGLVILTDSPERLRQRLYELRKTHSPAFDDLSFLISPTNPNDQLWIVKRHGTDDRDGTFEEAHPLPL